MLATTVVPGSRRRALRRAVDLECGVLSAAFQDVAALSATDLSPHGMWLATDMPLALGDEVVLSFTPPRWPAWGAPLVVLGEVVRVGMPRRRGDSGAAGMGVRFVDLDPEHESRMQTCLLGMPPTLPSLRARRAERREQQLVLDDGSSFEFCAEAPLLTAGRPAAQATVVIEAEPVVPNQRVARRRRSAPAHAARGSRRRTPRGAERRSPRPERTPPVLAV